MNKEQNLSYVTKMWDEFIVPALMEYIKIPNKSPAFDQHWEANGHMAKAVALIADWCKQHAIVGMTLEVVQLAGRTPVIYMDIPGQNQDTVLLYGHLDKQPEMMGWDEGLGPWKPVLRDDRLYGRGAADDGYAAFASLTAIKSLNEQGIPHGRCVILIEACEESGSIDLPYYIDALQDKIGKPSLVICLDSGCGNYEQLWLTTSLRGLISGILSVDILTQGVHSGAASGIVPACFRIIRQLLDRLEDDKTGDITLADLYVEIPPERKQQAIQAASALGKSVYEDLPFVTGAQPDCTEVSELILRRTWKPTLSIIGADGIPSIENAGNVTLPSVSVKLSLRLPPLLNPEKAALQVKQLLESHPPYHANITFTIKDTGPGWNAPPAQPWLAAAANKASRDYFGKEAMYLGEGGSIPFMGMLGEKFPQAQFVITGLLGPASNAHGPNEFLHIPTGKKLTACIADIIAAQYQQLASLPTKE